MIEPVITIDVDWAPDHMIEAMARTLIETGVRATWFVTHDSPALRGLRDHPELFELGAHPNFLPGSTHGRTPAEVLAHVRELVPDARSVRTHGLVQSTALLDQLVDCGYEIDVSLFLPRARNATPFEQWWSSGRLLRVPFVWEDDFEFHHPQPIWTAAGLEAAGEGLTVLDFHPVHVFLNSSSPAAYSSLRAAEPGYPDVSASDSARFVAPGSGTATIFTEVVSALGSGAGGRTIAEVAQA